MSKMNNTSNYLDKSVIYIFLIAFFVSMTVFAFKYSKYSPCDDVNFNINTNNYTIGSLIKFEDVTEGANEWEWDFGDNTLVNTQKKPLKIYYEPGEYNVRLLVNGICEKSEFITILDKKEILDPSKFPVFNIPKTIKVGKRLSVEDETENATTWEWRFGETAKANANTRLASYIYKEAGYKTVSLIVNGELKYISNKKIEVLPLNEVKEEIHDIPVKPANPDWGIKYEPEATTIKDKPNAPKLVPYISHEDFKQKIILVSKEKMSPNQFVDYFCGDINKPIIVNGKNTTFLVFCEKIKGKKIKIKKFEIFRDQGSNCIKNITMDYKKTGLGLF